MRLDDAAHRQIARSELHQEIAQRIAAMLDGKRNRERADLAQRRDLIVGKCGRIIERRRSPLHPRHQIPHPVDERAAIANRDEVVHAG
jgi:hypothetical protein